MSVKAPSEAFLKKVEAELRKLPSRSQRAVGGGIYMRLDANGRRRFQFRTRGGSQPAGTYDAWAEVVAARDERDALADEAAALGGLETVTELRKLTVRQYAPNWWKRVLNDLDITTQLDYERGLRLALEVAGRAR